MNEPLVFVRSPEEKVKRDQELRKFEVDLDAQAETWMKDHPEAPGAKNLFKKPVPPNQLVEVRELASGNWSVLLDGRIAGYFFGPTAQLQATRKAAQLLMPRADYLE